MSVPKYKTKEVQNRAEDYLRELGYPENAFHPDKSKLTSFGKAHFSDRFSQNKTYRDEISAVVELTDWNSFNGVHEPSPVCDWYPDWKIRIDDLLDSLDLKYKYIELIDSCNLEAETIDSTSLKSEAIQRTDTGDRLIDLTGKLQDGRWFHLSIEFESGQNIIEMIEPYFPCEQKEGEE